MIQDRHFHIARFNLEAATPLSISTGSPDGVFDTALVSDANGLPAIPGSSLAGVLRHLYQDTYGEDEAKALFGYQEPGVAHAGAGWGSRVQMAWGCILDSSGRPVDGLALGEDLKRIRNDALLSAVLSQAEEPVFRNRVNLGPRGAASDLGKFDRAVLPAGHRFACELVLWTPQRGDTSWRNLLALLTDPRLCLGGITHAGLGRMKLTRLYTGCFDLAEPANAQSFRDLGRGIGDIEGLTDTEFTTDSVPDGWTKLTLKLKAQDSWRIGQGDSPLGDYDKEPDAIPVVEERIVWRDGRGERRSALPLVPGSAVKGALAHRVAFYANCLADTWAETGEDPSGWNKSEQCLPVRQIFGYSKQRVAAGKATGQAGRLLIDDTCVELHEGKIARLMHNAIDRFTGGVRDRLLFSEELLWQSDIELRFLIHTARLSEDARKALRLALDDLLDKRLPLGAGGGKGHGRFKGTADPALDKVFGAKEVTA